MIYYSNSKKETQKLAAKLADEMRNLQVRLVIALEGELGAGKTTFAQAFVGALGVKAKIKSPTFNIVKKYEIRNTKSEIDAKHKILNTKYVYHIDCYRLKDHKDALPIGIKEIFKEKDALVLIEWPERIGKILPKKLTRVHIDHISHNRRKIQITPASPRRSRGRAKPK